MAIVLRFVDKDGIVRERFFDIVHVLNTASATLKTEICSVLARHNLSVQNIRGQGYDGASNMRGRWNGLQALFLKECPFAYYIHCFAHRLQLALVAASREVIPVGQFFSYLTLTVNIIDSSPKKHDKFRGIQAAEIAERLAIDNEDDDEFETELCSHCDWAPSKYTMDWTPRNNRDLHKLTQISRNQDEETRGKHSKGKEVAGNSRGITRPPLNFFAILNYYSIPIDTIDTSCPDKLCRQLYAGVYLKPNKLWSSCGVGRCCYFGGCLVASVVAVNGFLVVVAVCGLRWWLGLFCAMVRVLVSSGCPSCWAVYNWRAISLLLFGLELIRAPVVGVGVLRESPSGGGAWFWPGF
ncbi:hypothetical protein RHMOL_Rhmol10G0213400 [Rhododendron molle]|uniref:Uncharacterized protein n=1 Tax=Rhododendron molle TaxID=49168 RepID=A0ACC0M5S7_RHOML|nr:hypothetical protein RHMOL_Rhmol10G0213400 [Rhododendron molle]